MIFPASFFLAPREICFRSRYQRSGRRGVALVIVLSFVVLLSGLLVAYFSRSLLERQVSFTSGAQARTEQLAKAALGTVVGDLRQEIAAGSTINTAANNSGGQTNIYLPNSAFTSQPARLLTTGSTNSESANLPNLLRRSMRQSDFNTAFSTLAYNGQYSGGFPTAALASNVSTTDKAVGGRIVALSRWNQPKLMPTSPTDLFTSSFKTPDWVLVTRDGPQVFSALTGALKDPSASNGQYVVGRYAYTIYNEGNLLNINVAGRPAGIPATELSQRSLAALADLTQIPGITTQASVNQFVAWRNAKTPTPYASPAPVPPATPDPTNYFGFVTNPTTSFLQVSAGNQTLLNRQELLAYATTNPTLFNWALALPYLGTFSREVNAPSFYPKLTNFQPVAYDPNTAATKRPTAAYPVVGSVPSPFSGYDDEFNPPLASVRWPSVASATNGNIKLRDGSTVHPGEPLFRKRFRLDRLALLSDSATCAQDESQDIYHYFGLYRTSNGNAWIYDHGDPLRIMTPKALAAAIAAGTIPPRDPDFFETLQAALTLGSMGKDAGVTAWLNADNQAADVNVYLQVLQIGANIIDQADADNIPTEISLQSSTGGSSGAPAYVSVYGVENLPYLLSINDLVTRVPSNQDQEEGWFVFELWNPHQNPNRTLPALRIAPEKSSAAYVSDYAIYPPHDSAAAAARVHVQSPVTVYDGTSDLVITPASGTTFEQPSLIVPTGTGYQLSSANANNYQASWSWAGISAGIISPFLSTTYSGNRSIIFSPLATFNLQYKSSSGSWRTYSKWKFVEATKSWTTYNAPTPPATEYGDPRTASFNNADNEIERIKLDPRIDRWASYLTTQAASNGTYYKTPLNDPKGHPNGPNLFYADAGPSMSEGFYPIGGGTTTRVMAGMSRNTKQTPDNTHPSVYYTDPDGVIRMADSMYATSDQPAYGYPMAQIKSDGTTINPYTTTPVQITSRPIILNRPFKSVMELGYVLRDDAWRNLDFYSSASGDSALLDAFCVGEDALVLAGKVNVNTPLTPVLQAFLTGAARHAEDGTVPLTAAEATKFARQIVAVSSVTPFHNKSDLINRLAGDDTAAGGASFTDTWGNNFGSGNDFDARVIPHREGALRSLGDATSTRTWNLMIDLIAQTGRYGQTATDLTNFNVEGEKHYWLHVAIDRYTGQIVDQQLEPVAQ